MEKVLSEFIKHLNQYLGDWAPLAVMVIIGIFLFFLSLERFQKAGIASSENKNKKFETFLKVFDSELNTKQPIVIEQGFSHYFGFSLSVDEIERVMNSIKPTEMVNDVKRALTVVRFDSEKSEFEIKSLLPLNFRKYLANTLYWMLAMIGFGSLVGTIVLPDISLLLPSIIAFIMAGYSLSFVSTAYAAERIKSQYPQKHEDKRIILPS
ncbi:MULTISPECIES: hypothetical protein [Vibrio harveyi group]|uniref:hypothetical protein n=1 Tax=Vibrio harveyi group TaxID=717610 RepID=UPI00046FB109|nr:hypothetical protein [Vibrio parahaemolyticus]ELB2895545.1 hypothetical protein [Vibrio alginolyticus]OAR43260.1 hypothetical protein EM55_009985 [Vibrio parahaemolyticus]